MKSLNIVIDSNFLKRDKSFSKMDLLLIKELGALGLVKLHIPWFIYQECVSTSINDLEKEIKTSVNSLSNLDRKGMHSEHNKDAEKIIAQLEQLNQKIDSSAEMVWDKYIQESKGIIHPFDASDSIKVFQDYFKGNPPFSSLKNRKDIPDAFIVQTLQKIAKHEPLHFISEDENLRVKSAANPNIIGYPTYEAFFTSEVFKSIQVKFDEIKKSKHLLEKLVKRTSEIEDFVGETFGEIFQYCGFHDVYIPSKDNQCLIEEIIKINSISLVKSNTHYVGEFFYVPVEVVATCKVKYEVYTSELQRISSARKNRIEHIDEKTYLVHELIPILFKYKLGLSQESIEKEQGFNPRVDIESIGIRTKDYYPETFDL